ncbi:hypothetical protein PSACC_01578 [Paramicrosporidium saccamoebae]|uniref:Diphthine--ammonia ligase n=1 Tax=Paramicrosporidium saccamoebae TaxID=1246581 RepID=A0A2H9TLG9_9FUNG|nr:hypothetical protein PSACC_01578 [Paramicrosporidium saccamoebae]
MMRCVQEGHEIVALANLYPTESEELDSYMYQSVGHDAIVAYAECLNLPLYRRAISGRPVNLEYDYAPTERDEVEDLYELLVQVQREHPDVQGVSSGAILSTYQKNRVENICLRLGMTSLAYLWAAEQHTLLQDMIDSQLQAIIIKVAVFGLDKNDLGKSLAELQPKLVNLAGKFGINVCGEGGEFESLTLDCPLFKRRLVIDETTTVIHKESESAQVAYLKITKWHLEEKQ